MRTVIVLCVVAGALIGLITSLFTSFITGLVAGTIVALLTFPALLITGRVLLALETPEQRAINELSQWLEIEYGCRPDGCEIVFHEKGHWPLDGNTEHIFLCRFKFDRPEGKTDGIGLAWPNCFVLYDLDFGRFTFYELLSCYRGVYFVLLGRKNGMDAGGITESEWAALSPALNSSGFDAEVPHEKLRSQAIRPDGKTLLYAVEVTRDSKPIIAVGNLADPLSIETREYGKFDVPVAHYNWVDKWWIATRDEKGK